MGNQTLNFVNSTWPMDMTSRYNNNDQNGEKDKEEMIMKLLDLDLYEEGMSVEQMRERIEFIDDSKKGTSCMINNSALSTDSIEAVQSPTSSPVDNHLILNPPAKTIGRELTSPEAIIDSYFKQRSSQKSKESQGDILFNSRLEDTNIGDAVRAQKTIEEPSNRRYVLSSSPNRDANIIRRNHSSQEIKTYNSHRISKSMDNFDIFDCKVLPNDVPLKPRCLTKSRQKLRVVDGIPVIPDDISIQKLAYLTEMANLAYSWKAKLVCKEFSWGPPIKVGIANGTSDKFLIQEKLPDEAETPAQSCLITREDKSPISYSLRHTAEMKSTNNFSDDDEDFKKDRCKKTPKILLNRTEISQYQQIKNLNHETNNKTGKATTNVISLSDVSDNKVEKIRNTLNSRKRAISTSPECSEEVPSYPRRIVPPIPSNIPKFRKRNPISTMRMKKKTALAVHMIEKQKSKKSTSGCLNDQEIEDLSSKNEELKILDSAVPPTKRMRKGVEYLKKAQKANEDEKKRREHETQLAAEKEARERQERIQRRINEREEKRQQQEDHEKLVEKRENRYRYLTAITRSQGHLSGMFQKRTELESEKPRTRMLQLSLNAMDVDDTVMSSETIKAFEATEQPKCPICGKSFSLDEIENHAANCDDFVQEEPKETANMIILGIGRNLPTKFTCEICKFTSRDEGSHKKHFSQCVRSLTEEGSKGTESTSSLSSTKIMLSTHDSDVENDYTEKMSSTTLGKKKSKPQSRKKKF